jgi:nucleoside-diphosphate-sugar epimerase
MILVTGATGFVGREFIRQLLQKYSKNEILCLVYDKCDNELERSGRKNLDALGVNYIPIDLVSGRGMEKVPKSPDMIFHIASVTITASRDHRVNDVGTKNLINAIQPIKPGMNFIYTSTICVNDMRKDFSVPITESTEPPVHPANLYGRKKLIAENFLKKSAQDFNFSLSIIRVCGVYGPGARPNGLFDNIEKLTKKKSFLARMNWPGKISIINVIDMAGFIFGVSEKPPAPSMNNIYIPSIEALSMADMCKIVHKEYGIDYKEIKIPGFFWGFCQFFARKKNIVEYILPHKLYDTFWQACILVNNEFWNQSEKVFNVIPGWKPLTYEMYYRNKIEKQKQNV